MHARGDWQDGWYVVAPRSTSMLGPYASETDADEVAAHWRENVERWAFQYAEAAGPGWVVASRRLHALRAEHAEELEAERVAAIARADAQLRRELESIRDPRIRRECLDAF